jgi:hypothetical protein
VGLEFCARSIEKLEKRNAEIKRTNIRKERFIIDLIVIADFPALNSGATRSRQRCAA